MKKEKMVQPIDLPGVKVPVEHVQQPVKVEQFTKEKIAQEILQDKWLLNEIARANYNLQSVLGELYGYQYERWEWLQQLEREENCKLIQLRFKNIDLPVEDFYKTIYVPKFVMIETIDFYSKLQMTILDIIVGFYVNQLLQKNIEPEQKPGSEDLGAGA